MPVIKNLFDEEKDKVVPGLFGDEKVVPNLFPEEKTTEAKTPDAPWYTPQNILKQIERKYYQIPGKALLGDVPFIGKAFEDVKPESGLEKAKFGLSRFARDIYATSKITPLKGLKFLGAAGAFGAATAGSEEPVEIAKEAGKSAALFQAFNVGAKYIPKGMTWAYEKLPQSIKGRFSKVGQSIGLSLKKMGPIRKLMLKRRAQISEAQRTGEFLALEMENNLSLAEREILPFIREGTDIPKKLATPERLAAFSDKARRPVLLDWSKKLGETYDDFHMQMKDIYGDDIGHVKDYINRLWTKESLKGKEDRVASWFMTKPSNLKERVIKTVKEGVDKFGLEPETLDAARLFRYYNNHVTEAMANMKFLRGETIFENGKKIRIPGVKDLKGTDGLKAIVRADKAPKHWGPETVIDHPILRRAMGMKVGQGEAKTLLLQKVPVKVHPEIAEEMKALFGSRVQGSTVRAIEGINAWAKSMQLTGSLFHHTALTEAGVATGAFNRKSVQKALQAISKGEKPILHNPIAKDAIRHGLGLGSPTDVFRNHVESSLLGIEENINKNILKGKLKHINPFTPLKKGVEANNRVLWDYLHPNLKLMGYEKLVQDALKPGSKYAHLPVDKVKQEVAQFVNDTYGGQIWELMAKSPKWVQGMHLAFLSPDWLVSTMRQALSPFKIGAVNEVTAGLRAEMGQEFWKSAGVIFFTGINGLNRMYSQFHYGKQRDMWDNAPGHKTHLFLGKNKDGTEKYLRWGKQFRELPEFFIDPIKKMAGKLSPAIQTAVPFMSGTTTTGWDIKDIKENKFLSKKAMAGRAGLVGKMFVPFSAQNMMSRGEVSPLMFAFPVSRGMTYYKAKEFFREAIRNKDQKRIEEIYRSASDNGLDPDKIIKSAERDIAYEESGGYKKANEIFMQLQRMPQEAWAAYLNSLSIDEQTRKRVYKILKQKKEAERMQQRIQTQGVNLQKYPKILERLK